MAVREVRWSTARTATVKNSRAERVAPADRKNAPIVILYMATYLCVKDEVVCRIKSSVERGCLALQRAGSLLVS
jgi:hypothetical protein